MPRTPLLRALREMFIEHRLSRHTALPLDAVREARAEERHRRTELRASRRQFLAGAGLTAGSLAFGLPRTAHAAAGDPVIAVVGGGIAGLTCALRLLDRNLESTVYEASGRTGGRMFSNNNGYWSCGQVSEWCGELIDTGHRTVRKLAQRFGLPLDDLLAAQPAGSQDTYKFFGHYYPKAQADLDFGPVFDAVAADQAAAPFPTFYNAFTADGLTLDQMSIYDWIETRVPGGHTSPMGQLLDVAYAIEYGADTRGQSALNLIYLLAFQPHPHGFAVFGESDERFHIRGGNELLPQAIAGSLGVGTRVNLGWSLLRIAQTAGSRYRLTFDRGGSTTDVVADYVVLALPFAVLRELDYSSAGFDPLKTRAIQELGRGHNGKLQLQFTDRHWNRTGAWPGISNGSTYSDTGYQASWDVSRGQPGAAGIEVLYSGGSVTDAMRTRVEFARASNAQVVIDAANGLGQLEPVFPGISAKWNGKATQSLPHKSPFFKNSYAYYTTGQYTGFGGYEKARQGGVFFCGEHTSTDFQGFMEGGASEGRRAARELAALIRGHDDADIL